MRARYTNYVIGVIGLVALLVWLLVDLGITIAMFVALVWLTLKFAPKELSPPLSRRGLQVGAVIGLALCLLLIAAAVFGRSDAAPVLFLPMAIVAITPFVVIVTFVAGVIGWVVESGSRLVLRRSH